MNYSGINPEKILKEKSKVSSDLQDIDKIMGLGQYSDSYVKELLERNMVLLEALRKVKIVVDKLMNQNKELKVRIEILEDDLKEKGEKGVKVVSAARYNEMQQNANELSRSLPKFLKLIKLLNEENKMVKEKYAALDNEFSDLISERNELKDKIRKLNEVNQNNVISELNELFPTADLAGKAAMMMQQTTDETSEDFGELTNDMKQIVEASQSSTKKGKAKQIEKQAQKDLKDVGGFDNEQISVLVDLVTTINRKIENLSSGMVMAAPAKRRGRASLDLSDALGEGSGESTPDEPPERPDLEDVLDDILISG